MGLIPNNLLSLQETIGLEPHPRNEAAILTMLEASPTKRSLTVSWLAKNGIPLKNAQNAFNTSLAKAYCNPAYLRGWRNKINPSFALLGGEGEDGASGLNEPQGKALGEAQGEARGKEWVSDLYKQIETISAKLVDLKFDNMKVTLSEDVRNQVKTLAATEAAAIAERVTKSLLPPREIHITHDDKSKADLNLGLQHKQFPFLLRAVQAKDHRNFRLNIWLTGPTGSGKTTAAESVAKALGLPFGSDGSLDADYKVLGFRDANGNIVSTQFLEIYENGGIYVADEIDNWLPSALLSLNAALANGWVSTTKGMVKRHPDCCVIACANTWGLGATSDYVGRTRLDAASLDRFHPKINWPVDEDLERAVANKMDPAYGQAWHDVILAARHAAKRQGLKIIVSPRATFNGIALLQAGFSSEEVVEMTIAAGLSPEQVSALNIPRLALSAPTHTKDAQDDQEPDDQENDQDNQENPPFDKFNFFHANPFDRTSEAAKGTVS